MTRKERIQCALQRRPVDRTPYAIWRHFPDDDRTPGGLARATLEFQARWGSDFIKLTPRGGYAVLDWGCVEAETVEPDGHRPCARHAVNAARDWEKIRPLDAGTGAYGRELEALRLVIAGRTDDAPVVHTIFSPLSLARKLSGDRLKRDLAESPELVAAALQAIADTQVRFAAACLDAGAAGIFYSIQAASLRHHTGDEYRMHGEPHDRRILESVAARSSLTILHAHGDQLLFDQLASLPFHAINWEDRTTPPSLAEGKKRVKGAVIGGLGQWTTLRKGRPQGVVAEARDAVRQTAGKGLILGPGCVLPLDIPEGNIAALVSAIAE